MATSSKTDHQLRVAAPSGSGLEDLKPGVFIVVLVAVVVGAVVVFLLIGQSRPLFRRTYSRAAPSENNASSLSFGSSGYWTRGARPESANLQATAASQTPL